MCRLVSVKRACRDHTLSLCVRLSAHRHRGMCSSLGRAAVGVIKGVGGSKCWGHSADKVELEHQAGMLQALVLKRGGREPPRKGGAERGLRQQG